MSYPHLSLLCLALTLSACGGGGSSDSSVNPHGDCADSVAMYEEANDYVSEEPPKLSDFDQGNGNFSTFYLGLNAGILEITSFNWGTDYEGCEIEVFIS